VVSRVFWIALSAYKRYQIAEQRIATLEYVCKESRHANEKWWISTEHIAIWDTEHDLVIQHYIDKFQFHVKAWLASPAGVGFNSEMARRK
jgi:hypothetical protein